MLSCVLINKLNIHYKTTKALIVPCGFARGGVDKLSVRVAESTTLHDTILFGHDGDKVNEAGGVALGSQSWDPIVASLPSLYPPQQQKQKMD
jgi:hypothetical protein